MLNNNNNNIMNVSLFFIYTVVKIIKMVSKIEKYLRFIFKIKGTFHLYIYDTKHGFFLLNPNPYGCLNHGCFKWPPLLFSAYNRVECSFIAQMKAFDE